MKENRKKEVKRNREKQGIHGNQLKNFEKFNTEKPGTPGKLGIPGKQGIQGNRKIRNTREKRGIKGKQKQ